jgi:hypothetical protein
MHCAGYGQQQANITKIKIKKPCDWLEACG